MMLYNTTGMAHLIFLGLPSGLLFAGFPTKTLYAPSLSNMGYMTRQPYSSLYDHSNHIWRGVQIMRIFIKQPAPLACYIVPPRPKYRPRNPIPNPPSVYVLPAMRETKFNTHISHTSKCSCLQYLLSLRLKTWHNFATYISFCTKHRCMF